MKTWRTEPLAILDTETTGTDAARHRVVEVAIRIVSPGQQAFAKSWLLNPGCPVGEASAIHGITDDMLNGAPTFHDIAHELHMLVSACIPVAYNARFDRSMLIAEYLRARIDPPSFLFAPPSWLDVLVWAREHEPYAKGAGRHKLTNVAARMGVGIGTAHRAAGDCETTANVLERLATVPGLIPERLDDLLSRQRVLAAKNEASFLEWQSKQPKEAA